MKPSAPLNDLERLLAKKVEPQNLPELFRLLRETELVFLLPYHPEVDLTTYKVQNGDPLPPFVVWTTPQDGRRIPIFSAMERAQEAVRKVSHGTKFMMCTMPGQSLFTLLACQTDGIAINPATSVHSLMLDLAGVKLVAKPTADPAKSGQKTGKVGFILAKDYPTALVHALFQYLRDCPGVRAAWLTKSLERTEPGTGYMVFALSEGDQEKIKEGIIIVAGPVLVKGDTLHIAFADETNVAALAAAQKFTPFYCAPDYQAAPPSGLE